MTNGSIGTVGGLKRMMLQPTLGKSLGAGRLELAGRADLVGRVAGQHLVDGRRVVEQADRRIAHRADQRHLVVDLGELRQQLGELDAGQLGVDRLEDAADVVRNVVLGVPQVEVAGAALEVEEDDALGLAEAGAAVGGVLGRCRLLQAEEVGQAEAEHGRAADAQQFAAGDAVTGVFP